MRYRYSVLDTQRYQYVCKHANYLFNENLYLRSILNKQQTLDHATWVQKIKANMPKLFG